MKQIIKSSAYGLAALMVLCILGAGILMLRSTELDAAALAIKQENGPTAVHYLTPLAWLGDRTAQILLGSVYALGVGGVAKSDTQAIYWFERSGLFGDSVHDSASTLELSVADAYANGDQGVQADPTESLKWLRLAAKAGSEEAAARLKKLDSSIH